MNKNNENKNIHDIANNASQTVDKAGQALDKAVSNATSNLGTFFERHSELQGWIMLASGISIILYMLNLVSFMRYIFIALSGYLLVYGMYKSRLIDHAYNAYQSIIGKSKTK